MTLKKIVQLVLLLIVSHSFSQVGIGTTSPNESSQLEIVSNDKGILIPQIALTSDVDTVTITNGNIESLLIYNTSSTAGLSPGYYYWGNSKWNKLAITTDSSSISVDDNLTSTSATNALSANQGGVLKALVDVNSAKTGITTAQADAITLNTAKTGITTAQADAIAANTAKETNVTTDLTITGTTDARTIVSSDGTDAIIPIATTAESGLMSTTLFDAVTANTAKTGITTEQADAITANTAKTGITTAQADAITLNTAKTGITTAQADAIAANTAKETNVTTDLTITGTTDARTIVSSDGTDAIIPIATTAESGLMSPTLFDAVTANTAKTGITTEQADAITLNSAKTGITTAQADAITANTAKETNVTTDLTITGTTDARTIVSSDGTDAIIPIATTAESGLMSPTLFDAVTANTAKTGITTAQADAITANTAKTGITTAQADAIAANTAKETNVTTDLTITGTTDARTIVSSDGTDAIIPIATTAESGLMSPTLFDAVTANTAKTGITNAQADAITANTAKETNVTTDLTITGTTDARTIVSSDGTDAIIPIATTAESGLMSPTLFDAITANTAKTGITTEQADAITLNTAKTGITTAQAEAIAANTAKETNVTTDLTITGTTDARTIVSSDGTDAIIPIATTAESGLMSPTLFDAVTANTAKTGITTAQADAITANTAKTGITSEQVDAIAANTAKETNVTTDLTITGTTDARTIVSSDGTDAIIPIATTAESGLMSPTLFDAVTANTLKETNATHSGDVTGDVALTIANDAVTNLKIADDAVTTAKIGTAGVLDGNKTLTTDANGNPQWTTTNNSENIYSVNGTIGAGRGIGVTDIVNFDTNTFVIDGTNNRVGIGTSTPTQSLEVIGNIRSSVEVISGSGVFRSNLRPGYGLVLQGDRNMVLFDAEAPIWSTGTAVSDMRYKKDVKPFVGALGIIKTLDVIKFKYLDSADDGTHMEHLGMSAQQVELHFPEMVPTFNAGEPNERKLLHYEKLVSLAIQGIKELEAENNTLKVKNAEIEARLAAIEAKLQ